MIRHFPLMPTRQLLFGAVLGLGLTSMAGAGTLSVTLGNSGTTTVLETRLSHSDDAYWPDDDLLQGNRLKSGMTITVDSLDEVDNARHDLRVVWEDGFVTDIFNVDFAGTIAIDLHESRVEARDSAGETYLPKQIRWLDIPPDCDPDGEDPAT